MQDFIFPPFDSRIEKIKGKTAIFDVVRKKLIILTPEEWVRQHLVHYLINEMKYPKVLISVEDGLKYNKMNKRCDVLVYNRQGNVFMLVECKSAKVKLDQSSMDQLSSYNQHHKAEYLALTNGLNLIVCKMDYDSKKFAFCQELPAYK